MKKINAIFKTIKIATFAGVLLCASITAPPASAQDITTGLVGHWKLDETTGTTIIDESGNGNTGTWTSDDSPATVKSSAGMVGNAISFDDLDDGVSLGDNDNFDMTGTNAFTVSAWVKPALTAEDNGTATIFARGDTNAGPSGVVYNFFINSANRWQSEISDGTSEAGIFSEVGTVDFGQWQHMTLTWDGTDFILYKNATVLENSSNPGFILHDGGFGNSGETGFGYEARQNAHHFDGDLDEMRVYNRALTASDVETLYSQTGAQNGYFVLIGNQPTNAEVNEFDGDLGGLAGANATCMNYLTNYDWKGKNIAQANGMLTPDNVKAWLCDDNGCQNFRPNTPYSFAKTEAGEEDTGGASFTSDSNGLYPASDTNAWDGDAHFARNTFFWTGREDDQTNTPATNIDCSNWTSNASGGTILGNTGQTTQTDAGRWNSTSGPLDCDTTEQFVCFVNPVRSHTICNPNHTGKIIFNQDVSTMQYCNGTDWINMGKESSLIHGTKTRGEDYAINAVEFDGTTSLGANLASTWPGGHQLTGSMWIRNHNIVPTSQIFQPYDNADDGCRFQTIGDNIQCIFENDSGVEIINFTSNTSIAADTWYHVLFSFDTSSASSRHLYINGVADAATWTTYTVGESLDDKVFGDRTIGARNSGTSLMWDGDMADIWLNNIYIDLSVLANREKFIRDGNAVNLGTDGSRPTGSAPDIFLSGDTASWHTNKGTGGGFTENGALTDATTTPPATYEKKMVGWWKLDETSGTTAYDNSGEGHDSTISGGLSGTDSIPSPVRTGLNFDGTDDWIDTPFRLTAANQLKEFTFTAWVKPEAFNDREGVAGMQGNAGFKIHNLFGGLEHIVRNGAGVNICRRVSPYPAIGEWHFIVFSYDGDNCHVFENGSIVTFAALDNEIVQYGTGGGDGIFHIGRGNFSYGDGYWEGGIDDVRLYNYALSAAEVTELYNSSSQILSYTPNAVNLAGEAQQRVRNNCCSDADGTSFTGSMWIRFTDWPGDNQYIMDSNGENRIYFTSGGDMFFYFRSPTSTDRVVLTADTNLDGDYGWHHIIYSFDVTNPANSYVYMDDTAVTLDNTTINGTINFNTTNFTLLGQRNGNANLPHADIADFWFDYNTFIDLSVEANRRDFIDANGYPVDLGADGSTPTGSAPTVFLTSNAANMGVNSGSGNDFALVEGTFTDVPGPAGDGKVPRYCANPALPAGTLIFNTDEDVMQYCDGYQYIALGPQGDGGGGCSNPSGVAGSLIFNSDFNTLQYCEGDEWVGIGNDPTASVLAQGLVGHWRLDETGGTTIAVDSSGNGHNGTMQNGLTGVATASGATGSSLTFDDNDDSIDVPSSPDFALRNFTLSSWVYIPSTVSAGWKAAIAHNRSGNNWYFLGKNNSDNRMHFRWSNSDTMNSNAALTSDTWNLVTATYDYTTNTANIYVNGALDNTESSGSVQPTAVSDILRIGRNTNDTETWDGRLDDVRVYNRVLAASEIAALYSLADCPQIGDACNDGSVYAALRTYNGEQEKMYITSADQLLGIPWKTSTGIDDITVDSNTDGRANHNRRLGNLSDFPAFEHCENLVAHGKDDWYLPARNELTAMAANYVAINANVQHDLVNTNHWASTEVNVNEAYRPSPVSGGASTYPKTQLTIRARCVRRDSDCDASGEACKDGTIFPQAFPLKVVWLKS